MHNIRTKTKLLLNIWVCLQCVIGLGTGTNVTGLGTGTKDCLGQDQCSCQFTDDQSIIDLTSLGNNDETPR